MPLGFNLRGLEPQLIKLEFIIYLPKLKVHAIEIKIIWLKLVKLKLNVLTHGCIRYTYSHSSTIRWVYTTSVYTGSIACLGLICNTDGLYSQ